MIGAPMAQTYAPADLTDDRGYYQDGVSIFAFDPQGHPPPIGTGMPVGTATLTFTFAMQGALQSAGTYFYDVHGTFDGTLVETTSSTTPRMFTTHWSF